ncbi:MAG: hypothetical protein EXS05_09610 [Planctomycetaceae bacterium]|nr:hypothetical protein [Planctomycetaceae bacterium]
MGLSESWTNNRLRIDSNVKKGGPIIAAGTKMASPTFSYQALLQTLEKDCKTAASQRVRKTLRLACDGHRGQFRDTRTPDARVPFIVHPVGTALLAAKYFPMVQNSLADDLETVVCIALTHDLLEDTQIDQSALDKTAGPEVRLAVEALTKPPAGVIGKSKDTRNREFADQIMKGGPTAVFVKMCDIMHNISRPNTTPPRLFRSVVDKAQKLYLPLLTQCPLGNEFADVVRTSIAKAEQDALNAERFAKEKPVPKCLDEAISECMAASGGKVLELHDITSILDRVCGTLNTSIWVVGGTNADTLKLVNASNPNAIESESFQGVVGDSPAILTGKGSSKFPILTKAELGVTTFVIPMQVGPAKTFVATLVFSHEGPPKWLTLDAAALIVQFLAHRLILSESDRRARVATEAAKLGIQIDAELAAESGITPPDLLRLSHWRIRCSQAIETVRSLLNFHLLSEVSRDPLRQMIRIDSRVKTVNSILRKMTLRIKESTPRFEDIEDSAGVRVICPTLASMKQFEEFLQGEKADTAGCRLHPTIDRPKRDFISNPTVDGYRAFHLVLEVVLLSIVLDELQPVL